MALAILGISADDFYDLCPVEYATAIEIKQDIENRKQENFVKTTMEAARFVAVHIWNSAGRSLKRQQFDPKKLIPLSWDKQERHQQTPQEMMATMFSIAANQNATIRKLEKRKKK